MLSWCFQAIPSWRCARWPCLGLLAALVAGACRLDDRTLSDAKLLASGGGHLRQIECGSSGDNACETCLYDACCEQAQDCALGSSCASYYSCVAGCNSDEACSNRCAADYPSGVGDAVALSVCAGSRCTICSGQAPPQSCDPTGPGACQSSADCAALEAGALGDLELAACPPCEEGLLGAVCQRCLAQQSGLSAGCSSCVASWLSCAIDNCLLPCQGGGNPQACSSCMSDAGCTRQLASCGFAD
jgi:hypothetical protein